MTKVIKSEFEKLKDLNDEDVSLTCGTSLEVFNKEFNRMSGMDNDYSHMKLKLLTSHVTQTKMMIRSNECRMKLMMIWDMIHLMLHLLNVELTDEEFSDNEDEVAEVFRINTNIFDVETPMCKTFNEFNYLLQIDPDLLTKDIEGFKTYDEYKDDWIYEWNIDVPWVDEKPWTKTRVWTEPTPVNHYCKPFNYKTGCSEWPTCSWKNDGYCNRGNLPGAYIVGNSLHYQDYEWHDTLMDSELKEQALRNKAIMEGSISDEEPSNDDRRLTTINLERRGIDLNSNRELTNSMNNLKSHGLKMEYLTKLVIIFANLSDSRMGKLSGPPAVEMKMDFAMVENYLEWFELAI
ncbi:hypothetical protein Tco_0688320 [Tanacetum coccineum]